MNAPAHYVHWGFILISVANLLVISLMIAVFVAALLLPFPFGEKPGPPEAPGSANAGRQSRKEHE